jgi:hypothetical protein
MSPAHEIPERGIVGSATWPHASQENVELIGCLEVGERCFQVYTDIDYIEAHGGNEAELEWYYWRVLDVEGKPTELNHAEVVAVDIAVRNALVDWLRDREPVEYEDTIG